METRKIGVLDVTVVGVGCNNFGTRIDPEATKAVVDASIECRINFFDTADMYGAGKSEEYLGRALGDRRKDVVIATKFGMPFDGGLGGAKPDYIQRACDDSLARLGTEWIDLYQLHQPDPEVPIEDTLGALNELVQAGKVREIGCSNFDAKQLKEAQAQVHAGAAGFVSVQNHYSLLHREPEPDVLDECERQNLGFLPYFPLACGLLTGKYKGGARPEGTRIQEGSRWLTPEAITVAEKLTDYAESKGQSVLSLAFSWLLRHEVVSSVIAGATKAEQIRANAAAAKWKLTGEEMLEIDQISSSNLRIG